MVTSNKATCPGEGACWPIYTMNLPAVAVIKDSQIMGKIIGHSRIVLTRYSVVLKVINMGGNVILDPLDL